jgi:hypothetical protein
METLKKIIENEGITAVDCCHNAGAISAAVETTIRNNELPLEFRRPISRRYQNAYGFDERFSERLANKTKILYFDEHELFIAHVENGLVIKDKAVSKWRILGLEVTLS